MSRENGGKLRVAVVNIVGDRPLEGMGVYTLRRFALKVYYCSDFAIQRGCTETWCGMFYRMNETLSIV